MFKVPQPEEGRCATWAQVFVILRLLLLPTILLRHLICPLTSDNSQYQQVALGLERRERRQRLLAGKINRNWSINDWMTGSRSRIRLCPGEEDTGTIKDIGIQEEGVCSQLLKGLNWNAGVKSCRKCSVGNLEPISREIPAAEGLGELTLRKNMKGECWSPAVVAPNLSIHGTVKFSKNSSCTNFSFFHIWHPVQCQTHSKHSINICWMNENYYVPYTGPHALVEDPMVQNFLSLRKVIECNMPTGWKVWLHSAVKCTNINSEWDKERL